MEEKIKSVIINDSWDEVTISQYQKWCEYTYKFLDKYEITTDEDKEKVVDDFSVLDTKVEALCIFSNHNDKEFWESIPISQFNECYAIVDKMLLKPVEAKAQVTAIEYTIGGKQYTIADTIKNVSKQSIQDMRTNKYIPLLELQSEQKSMADMSLLHYQLAIMLDPVDQKRTDDDFNVNEHAEFLQENMNIVDALTINNFFFILLSGLMTGLDRYYIRKVKKAIRKGFKNPQKAEEAIRSLEIARKALREIISSENMAGGSHLGTLLNSTIPRSETLN